MVYQQSADTSRKWALLFLQPFPFLTSFILSNITPFIFLLSLSTHHTDKLSPGGKASTALNNHAEMENQDPPTDDIRQRTRGNLKFNYQIKYYPESSEAASQRLPEILVASQSDFGRQGMEVRNHESNYFFFFWAM